MKYLLILSMFLILLNSCAVPTSPSGGPGDKLPPYLLETYPKDGTTNFSGNEIYFVFNEYVNRGSFQKNLQIEPNLNIPYELKWFNKKVRIVFKEELPENTTLIITIGKELSDFSNNKLGTPKRFAISTGETIDNAGLSLKLIYSDNGENVKNGYLFLFREDDSIEKSAKYVSEPDTSGKVSFQYLRDGDYKLFYNTDINRNRIWDKRSDAVQALNFFNVTIVKDSIHTLGIHYVHRADTLKPTINGIGVLTENRMRFRFSEEIEFRDRAFNLISDSDTMGAIFLYKNVTQPNVVFAQSRKSLNPDTYYEIHDLEVTDLGKNKLTDDIWEIQGSSQPDTVSIRIISVQPQKRIMENESIFVSYSTTIDNVPPIVDSLIIIAGNETIRNYKNAEVIDNMLILHPDTLWDSNLRYEFRLYQPYTLNHFQFKPTIENLDRLGSIEIGINNFDTQKKYLLTLLEASTNREVQSLTLTDSVTVFHRIKQKEIILRLLIDEDENGIWNKGSINPYIKPEELRFAKVRLTEGMKAEVIF